MSSTYQAFIGVDPGQKGALAYLCPKDHNIDIIPMPISGKEMDVDDIVVWIKCRRWPENILVCIELVHSMPGQGVSSTFKFGFGTGMLHGIIRTLKLPLITVAPQTWKKAVLAGTDKSKEAAIDYISRKYPEVNLLPTPRSTKKSDGMAEALCIAEWASVWRRA